MIQMTDSFRFAEKCAHVTTTCFMLFVFVTCVQNELCNLNITWHVA